jgi:hypothetical protein
MRIYLQLAVKFLILHSICVLFFLLSACDKNRDKPEGLQVMHEEPTQEPMTKKKERFGEAATGNMPGITCPVENLSPEIFIRITIQYKKGHTIWLQEAQNIPPDDREDFIEKKNRAFFERLGITEDQYISYSQKNINVLNAYIEEHPELLPEVMDY